MILGGKNWILQIRTEFWGGSNHKNLNLWEKHQTKLKKKTNKKLFHVKNYNKKSIY